jgi:hypothetical protein
MSKVVLERTCSSESIHIVTDGRDILNVNGRQEFAVANLASSVMAIERNPQE